MPFLLSRRRFVLMTVGAAAFPLTGCDKGGSSGSSAKPNPTYDGQYKNAKGKVVLELKDGKATYTNPSTKQRKEGTYREVEANRLVIDDEYYFTFAPPGTISGLDPAIAGEAGPIKK